MTDAPAQGTGTWVVLPTYDEADNLPGIAAAILEMLPTATLLVVDDSSPDGTGELAEQLARDQPRIRVHHRPGKEGLGRAYLDGFRVALDGGATSLIQMDADWSHDPAVLPSLLAPIVEDRADLVIGSRYVKGGKVLDWGIGRRIVSRGGSLFARVVLGLHANDLTGGFKAWRGSTLAYRASRAGARVAEVPITFRDRLVGTSKMSRRIIIEALVVVLRLRWDEIRKRRLRRRSA
jgi:dolichol-phosphate mannosyltransferase